MTQRKTIRRKQVSLAALMEQAYPELRRIAGQQFQAERPSHTWQPTELVHEVFLRLAESGPDKYVNRAHFFGTVARAMRRTLVEHARRRQTKKRGGAWHRVALEEADLVAVNAPDFIAFDKALIRLRSTDPLLHRIAELRVFAGLSTEEISSVLHRGKSTVRRDWSIARVWLQRDLSGALDIGATQ
jgi:RNA polymerase sigma factor (TIGR02999 family)